MPSNEPAIRRVLEGLAAQSGRTVVVVGPPGSGKSALLNELAAAIESARGRTFRLRGTYRGRTTPFSALDGLDSPSETAAGAAGDGEEGGIGMPALAPMVPLPTEAPSGYSSRRRGGRARVKFLGEVARGPGLVAHDPDDFWAEMLPQFRGPEAHPVGLLLDDAGFADSESREFLVALSARARLRPLVIAIALDPTVSTATVWEEALLGRPSVDWVRFTRGVPDPREVHRLHEILAELPPSTARLLGYVTLLGGEGADLVVSRIARLSVSQLSETLQPALSAGIAKISDGKVSLADPHSARLLEDLFSEEERRAWHLEIADGLQALSAEPPLARRVEIAEHSFASARDAVAMARLFEAAEISLGVLQFDQAARLLAEAIACLADMPPASGVGVAPEIRLLHARALFYGGRPTDAEAELREGVEAALRFGASAAELVGWIEPLLPALAAAGPRATLATLIGELGDRLHDAGLLEPEVLLETMLPIYAAAKNQVDRARAEALRAAQNARRLRERPLQALGLFTIGASRFRGTEEEMLQAERFLAAARHLLRESRRWELDYLAGEFECRLLEARGAVDQALITRQQSLALLQRARLPSVGLLHELGIAQIQLDRGDLSAADGSLDRAARAAESLRLVPPAPGLLQTWLLEGRRYAITGSVAAARDRWSALVDLPPALGLPRLQGEALLRLALLERSVGNHDAAETLVRQLEGKEVASAFPQGWPQWTEAMRDPAISTSHGGGPLLSGAGSRPAKRERRERGRR